MPSAAQLDHRHVWHPFTQMRDWLKKDPIVIVSGKGAVLRDSRGHEYLDANSSIWTNLHGHAHPKITAALHQQAKKIAHSSFLGLTNERAAELAGRLVKTANPPALPQTLQKVFYSDNGSTAMEAALKIAFAAARRSGLAKPKFLSLENAYHGDTIGAVSLGQSPQFHQAFSPLLFKTDKVAAPYCYRCPHNRAAPQRKDARLYRQCETECLTALKKKFERGAPYAGFVFEPRIQGAAGMVAQPEGWLSQAASLARRHETPLIADEVMTGFGRTGTSPVSNSLFACHHEKVQPDFMALAKGMTGGALPMAATLTTRTVFDKFLGEYSEFKTFFHGHSYTGNQLGSAAALASLDLLQESLPARRRLQDDLAESLEMLWDLPRVGDMRQVGLLAGVELVRDWRTREPYPLKEQAGIRVCEAMARRGVLTRPIGNVIVLMPPYCTTRRQVVKMIKTLYDSLQEILS